MTCTVINLKNRMTSFGHWSLSAPCWPAAHHGQMLKMYQEDSEVRQMVAQTRCVVRGAVVLPAAVTVPATLPVYTKTSHFIQI